MGMAALAASGVEVARAAVCVPAGWLDMVFCPGPQGYRLREEFLFGGELEKLLEHVDFQF